MADEKILLAADKSFYLNISPNTTGVYMAGMDEANLPFSRLESVLQDDERIQYHNDYMSNLLDAIR